MDKNPLALDVRTESVVTDEDRKIAYRKACEELGVEYNESKKVITAVARNLYRQYHPDKNMN
jgi:DnaJ-domain-containing protein 1